MAAYRAAEGKNKGKGASSNAGIGSYLRDRKGQGSQDTDIDEDYDRDENVPRLRMLQTRMESSEVWTAAQTHMLQQQIKMQQQQLASLQEQSEKQRKLINMALDCLIFLLKD